MADAHDGPLAIKDHGLIGDCRSAALVGRNGSIDWLCRPRFESATASQHRAVSASRLT
jgi:GH15 family glucan-1,4-alpha-glucosidase